MLLEPEGAPQGCDVFVISPKAEWWWSAAGVLEAQGHRIVSFDTTAEFLTTDHAGRVGVVIFDESDDERTANVLDHCRSTGCRLLPILASGSIDSCRAVRAIRAGAFDVIRAPGRDDLSSSVRDASDRLRAAASPRGERPPPPCGTWPGLTRRQSEILVRILKGQPNKIIAADLGISLRTAENHRAHIMRKMGASSISNLVKAATAPEIGREHPSFAPLTHA